MCLDKSNEEDKEWKKNKNSNLEVQNHIIFCFFSVFLEEVLK